MGKKATTKEQADADQLVTPEPPQVMDPSKPLKKQTKGNKKAPSKVKVK